MLSMILRSSTSSLNSLGWSASALLCLVAKSMRPVGIQSRFTTPLNSVLPTQVRLAHQRDGKCPEMTEFFGREIEFGADIDEVLFAPNIRDLPVVSADLYLNRLLIRYCEEALARRPAKRSPFRSSVENAIVPLLPHGKARADIISRRLGVSQRTLARRLSSEQISFSGVLENLKMDLAKRYLADEALSVVQVAWLLGYQEVSSVTHAFKRWTNKTPRQTRTQKAA